MLYFKAKRIILQELNSMTSKITLRKFTVMPEGIRRANIRVVKELSHQTAKLLIDLTRETDQVANTGLWVDPILGRQRNNELPKGRKL